MNGPGCKTCPVQNCDTLKYRGSRCAALRDRYGLDDPDTENSQKIPPESQKILVIPLETWERFYKELTSNLEPYDHYDTGYRDALDRVDDWLATHTGEVPTQPTIGHWDVDKGFMPFISTCSQCGWIYDIDGALEWNFCPNCGARMLSK